MAENKANVQAFDRDAVEGGYVYARQDRLSSVLANARMSRAIVAATSFAGRRVVDLGCGDGSYTVPLRTEAGASYVLGIDPAPAAIELARDRAAGVDGCEFVVGSIYDPPPGQSFDIAVIRGVLHHLSEAERAVAAAVQMAERVVILEPNGTNPVLKLIEKLSPYHRAHEERSFLPATIDRWIRKAGARVVRREFINLVPMFCPERLAQTLKALESYVEHVPGVNAISCAQYVVTAERDLGRPVPTAKDPGPDHEILRGFDDRR